MNCEGRSVTDLEEMKTFSRGTCGPQSEYHTVETMDPKKRHFPRNCMQAEGKPSQWGICLLEGDFTQFQRLLRMPADETGGQIVMG